MPVPFESKKHVFEQPGLLDVLPIATDFFNTSTARPLVDLDPFAGSGVYGLYYKGAYGPYAPLAARNANDSFTTPIYIGKAIPPGGRTGIIRENSTARPLFNRLGQHRSSIIKAHEHALESGVDDHIKAEDFYFRFMIIPDKYWPLIAAFETGLIIQHQPLWNTTLLGFGVHDPGVGRINGKVSLWDSLHPGRRHANSNSERYEQEAIFAKVKQYLAQQRAVEPGLFS